MGTSNNLDFCSRIRLFDIHSLIYVRDNPKKTLLFAGTGLLICAKLITLSVIVPFSYLGIVFGAFLSLPVLYLIRCLANNPDSMKKAFFDIGEKNKIEKQEYSGFYATIFKYFW